MNINKLRLKNKNKYLIVSSKHFNEESIFLDFIANVLNNGTEIIILDEEHFNSQKIIETGKKIRELCSIYNAIFLLSERLDIAQIIEADGVYLKKNSIKANITREFIGENKIIGIELNKENTSVELADFGIINNKIKLF